MTQEEAKDLALQKIFLFKGNSLDALADEILKNELLNETVKNLSNRLSEVENLQRGKSGKNFINPANTIFNLLC